jgi:hypothetical protein
MYSYLVIIITVVILLILIIIYIQNLNDTPNDIANVNNEMNINNKHICQKDGCPVVKNQNSIYKLYIDYSQKRNRNMELASKNKNSFIFPTKGPKNIFIIRHGEKLKTLFSLDCNGILRSTYIPMLIENLNKAGYGVNDIITALGYTSMHREQTVMLTSWLLNIPLFMYGDLTEIDKTIKMLFTNNYFNGKTVLICWEHNCIQDMVKAIVKIGTKEKGIKDYKFENELGNNKMPYWNDNDFSTIYHFNNELKFDVLNENIKTCFKEATPQVTYGKEQKCKELGEKEVWYKGTEIKV